MRVLVAGGGSGGHLYPAVAILGGFRARGAKHLGYIGARRKLERHVLSNYPWIQAFLTHGRGLPRRLSWSGLSAIFELSLGLLETLFIICKFRPTVIIGTGGFTSFAPVLWGILLRIPTVVHEVNVVPGLVSRLLAPWADLTLVAYPRTARLMQTRRVVVTGVPLRPELLQAERLSREDLSLNLGLDPRKRTVLVLGGSRGAAPLNRAVLKSRLQRKDLQVLLITGKADGQSRIASPRRDKGIIIHEYLNQMGRAFRAADLVISRAGAATLAELTALGKPAVLVPWPGAAENHQELNARFLEQAGGARVLSEKSLEEIDLLQLSSQLLIEEGRLKQMAVRSGMTGRRDGLERVIQEVERLIYTLSASAGRE